MVSELLVPSPVESRVRVLVLGHEVLFGAKVLDPHMKKTEVVTLPDVRAGIVMVVQSFDRVSYAMVMESERDMRVYDFIRNP